MRTSPRLTPLVLGIAAILILGASIAAAGLLPTALAPNQAGQSGPAQASPGPEEGPSAAHIQRVLDRLAAAGITTTANEFATLAQKYGVGGAIRVLAFAHAAGKNTADIAAMFDAGKGWGQIRRELGITIRPGIGWILGHGQAQADKADKSDEASENETDD